MSDLIRFPGRHFNLKFKGDELPFHPLASLFPLLEGAELVALKDDIGANGLREPIVLLEGLILDGRNRFLACHGLSAERGWPDSGFEPPVRFEQFNGDDPLAYVLSLNLQRRHLNESQRAMVAAKLATMSEGRPTKTAQICAVSQDAAAAMLGVGRRSVQSARKVLDSAERELIAAVNRGEIAVSVAADLATRDKKTQRKAASDPKSAPHLAKKERRREREAELGARQLSLPNKRYGVILADPEWDWKPYSRETGMDRAAANHYPTSSLEAIKQRDVASIAADDAVLFLWATAPMMPEALDVMAAWGFVYKSQAVWKKDRIGTGYWFRNQHELLLVGVRGSVPAPAHGTQFSSLIEAPVGEHSAKPDVFHQILEAYFPTLPKIELNRRGPPRAGWDAWGLEAEFAEAAE